MELLHYYSELLLVTLLLHYYITLLLHCIITLTIYA